MLLGLLVGAAGFEPTTCSTQNCRATRLRYTPILPGSIHAWAQASKATGAPQATRLSTDLSTAPILVRVQPRRAGFGVDFGRHHALGAGPEPYQHILPGPEFGHSEPPQRLHVHKYIRGALAAGQEAEAAQAVEPFDLR